MEGDFLFGAELVDLALRTAGDALVLDVEAVRQFCVYAKMARISNNSLLFKLNEGSRVPVNVLEALAEVGHAVATATCPSASSLSGTSNMCK